MKLFVPFGFVFSVLLVHNAHCLSFGIKDIGKSVVDTGSGIINKVPDIIPTPSALFQSSKNVVAGYPVSVVYKLINTFCKCQMSECFYNMGNSTILPFNTRQRIFISERSKTKIHTEHQQHEFYLKIRSERLFDPVRTT